MATYENEVHALKIQTEEQRRELNDAAAKLLALQKTQKGEEGKWQTERKILQDQLKKCTEVCQLLIEGVTKGQQGGVYTLEEAATLYINIKQLKETLSPTQK